MQIGHAHLTPMERTRRFKENLCLYCGRAGHLLRDCPVQPPTHTRVSTSCIKVPVSLTIYDKEIETIAMLDSGVAGNFIDETFALHNQIPLISCLSPLAVTAVDGRPLGPGKVQHQTEKLRLQVGAFHNELTSLFIIQSPNNPVILRLPWLQQHNPHISWHDRQITQWSEACFRECLHRLPQSR